MLNSLITLKTLLNLIKILKKMSAQLLTADSQEILYSKTKKDELWKNM